jgi:hypothetical protein
MSEIRKLLSSAQEAETEGRKDDAVKLLREAAAWYRDRQLLKRAAQMLRQARRVEGVEEESGDEVFGFGEEFEAELPAPVLVEERVPKLADPAADAWCSFCCRPKTEVGPVVAGPAGAFVCSGCVSISASLLSAPSSSLSPAGERARPSGSVVGPSSTGSDRPEVSPAWSITTLSFELPAQRRARVRFTALRARLSLVIGPEGTGKSSWLRTLATQPDVRLVEVTRSLTKDEEAELLRWLEPSARSLFLELRAPVPPPALVLQGEQGEELLHDTASLVGAVSQLSPAFLAQVDAVVPFDAPPEAELLRLASALAEARGVKLAEAPLRQLVQLAMKAKRGAHELATLVARIPPGTYGAS